MMTTRSPPPPPKQPDPSSSSPLFGCGPGRKEKERERTRPPPIGSRKKTATRAETSQANQKEARTRIKSKNRRNSQGSLDEEDLDEVFGTPRNTSSLLYTPQRSTPLPSVYTKGGVTPPINSDSETEIIFPANQLAALKERLSDSSFRSIGPLESKRPDADTETTFPPASNPAWNAEGGHAHHREHHDNPAEDMPLPGPIPTDPTGALNSPLNQADLIRILDSRLENLAKASDVDKVMQRVDQNAANVTKLSYDVRDLERKINDHRLQEEHHIRSVIEKVLEEKKPSPPSDFSLEECSSAGSLDLNRPRQKTAPSFLAGARNIEQETGRISQFELSRRSLRVWPIQGRDSSEIAAGVSAFLVGALMFTEEEVESMQLTNGKRVRPTRGGHAYDEVRISFATKEDRDDVMGKSRLLSSYVDDQRRPTAGIRIDVPPFLEPSFKLLYNLGNDLRRTHGPATRKYIKYDEEDFSLYLEIRLEGDRRWIKIDNQTAKEMTRESNRAAISRPRQVAPPLAWSQPLSRGMERGEVSANFVPVGQPRPRPSPSAPGLDLISGSTPQTPTIDSPPTRSTAPLAPQTLGKPAPAMEVDGSPSPTPPGVPLPPSSADTPGPRPTRDQRQTWLPPGRMR